MPRRDNSPTRTTIGLRTVVSAALDLEAVGGEEEGEDTCSRVLMRWIIGEVGRNECVGNELGRRSPWAWYIGLHG
jgi:hypothetical protein